MNLMLGGWSVHVEHIYVMTLVNRHNTVGTCTLMYTCLLCVVCVSRLSFWSCWCNLKRAVGAAGCSVPRVRGNPHLLLYGVAAFMWDREKISNQEVLR